MVPDDRKDTKDAEGAENVVDFPGSEPVGAGEIPALQDLPEGVGTFYADIQGGYNAAFTAIEPFQEKHLVFDTTLREILRYLELATMYMDRFNLYVNNPHLVQPIQRPSEPPADVGADREGGPGDGGA